MTPKINHEIRAKQVRVIVQQGTEKIQAGVMHIKDAAALAQRHGVDLVEISPTTVPPVCLIVDFGKYRYEQEKGKKKGHVCKLKEIHLHPSIDKHDFETKVRQGREFLAEGHKIKVFIDMRGREMAHAELGFELMQKFQSVMDNGKLDGSIQKNGKSILAIFSKNK